MPNYLRQQSPWVGGNELAARLAEEVARVQMQRQLMQQRATMGFNAGMTARSQSDLRQTEGRKNEAATALDIARENFEQGRISDQEDAKQRIKTAMAGVVAQNYQFGQFPMLSNEDAASRQNAGMKAAVTGQAMSTANGAASLLQPRNVGPGQIAANSFGNVTAQSPYSPVLPQGATVYNNEVPQSGNVMTPRGAITTQPNGSQIFGQPVVPTAGRGAQTGLTPRDVVALNSSAQNVVKSYSGFKNPQGLPGYSDATNNAAIFGDAAKALLPHILTALTNSAATPQAPTNGVPAQPDATPQAIPGFGGGQTPVAKPLTPDIAAQYLQKAGGNKDAARQAARMDGYNF